MIRTNKLAWVFLVFVIIEGIFGVGFLGALIATTVAWVMVGCMQSDSNDIKSYLTEQQQEEKED